MDRTITRDDAGGLAVVATEVVFSLDGDTYRLLICPAGRDRLHAILAPYITAGRRVASPAIWPAASRRLHRAAGPDNP